MLPTTLGAPSSKSKSSPAVLPALHVNSAKWPSSFSLLFSLLLLLLLVLSFHVRDVVQKANKEARLTEYGQELGRVSDRLQALYGEADNLAEVYLSAKGEQQIGGKKKVQLATYQFEFNRIVLQGSH